MLACEYCGSVYSVDEIEEMFAQENVQAEQAYHESEEQKEEE